MARPKSSTRLFADSAEAYGDQTERGHAALVKAIKVGKVAAAEGV